MTESSPPTKSELLETGIKPRNQNQDPIYPLNSQLQLIVSNIKIYASFLRKEILQKEQLYETKQNLIEQLWMIHESDIQFQELQNLRETFKDLMNEIEGEEDLIFENLNSFVDTLDALVTIKQQTQSEEEYNNTQLIITGLLKQMETILNEEEQTLKRLEKYEIYSNNLDLNANIGKNIKRSHYHPKQKISFGLEISPSVFDWVEPSSHRKYVSQVIKVYHEIVPFKIKHIIPGDIADGLEINVPNYFKNDVEPEKAVMHFVQPNTKSLFTYQLQDICKTLTIESEYLLQRQLPIKWTFSPSVRTVITPEGRIFALNSKTDSHKIDSSMYEILEEKVSNKGRRPNAKRNCGFIYANNALYVIGGNNDKQLCSQKNYRYSFKNKKWSQIADSNVALRKPTVCVFRDRYIIKVGGLNQFNYISKNIELYDTKNDRWSLVRASPRNIMEEVQILEDSLAVQIAPDQIYVFSGKNRNNFQSDSGFVLQLNEIIERQRGPAKVIGEFWNVSISKRNLFSFFGLFSQSNVITHFNCLYGLRMESCK